MSTQLWTLLRKKKHADFDNIFSFVIICDQINDEFSGCVCGGGGGGGSEQNIALNVGTVLSDCKILRSGGDTAPKGAVCRFSYSR